MRTPTMVLAVLLGVVAASRAEGQEGQWSVEGRIGSTLPTGELSGEPLNQTAGMSIGADVIRSMGPRLSVFGGLGHHRFECQNCAQDISTTGVEGGVKYLFGTDPTALPWVRAGLTVSRPSVDGEEGDWNPGLDSGVGIDWAVGPTLTLVPALRYNRYTDSGMTLSYFTIDLGGHLHVGGSLGNASSVRGTPR